MFRLILPECQTCDIRFATGFGTKLCVQCQVEVEALEAMMEKEEAG